MGILVVLPTIALILLLGRLWYQYEWLRHPLGVPAHLVYDRQRLLEIRTIAWRVAEGIRHSMEAGCVVDNVEADVERLKKLEPGLKGAHEVRNALGSLVGTALYAIARVDSKSEEIETQECQILLARNHERLQDAIARALA